MPRLTQLQVEGIPVGCLAAASFGFGVSSAERSILEIRCHIPHL